MEKDYLCACAAIMKLVKNIVEGVKFYIYHNAVCPVLVLIWDLEIHHLLQNTAFS